MGTNNEGKTGKRVGSVVQAFDVVGVIKNQKTVRIDDIASALDIPRSTAHVYLKTLESIGYVVQNEDGYRLSFRFLRDGSTVREQMNIYPIVKPIVEDLADETGEVANFGVAEEGQRVIIYQAEGTEAVYDNAPIGEYTNMHWTALGKAILAYKPEERIEEIISTHGLPGDLDNTITDSKHLLDELATIRDQNYAIEDEERREGIQSLAIPITAKETVIGALSVSGPKERFSKERIQDQLLPKMRNKVNIIEIRYSFD